MTGADSVCRRLVADCRTGSLQADINEDMPREKRSKLSTNGLGALLALTGETGPEMHADPDSCAVAHALVAEACAVFDAAGLSYERPDEALRVLSTSKTPDSKSWEAPDDDLVPRPSTWQDLHYGRGRVEIDGRNGVIVRLGAHFGVPTPANRVVQERCNAAAATGLRPGCESGTSLLAAVRSTSG
ncbi:MAG: ketopantoate reductase [Myxococcota bacterium]